MINVLKAMTDSTRMESEKKAAKRSVLNNLTVKAKYLFVLVSAKSFADANPKMNADALTMIQDKSPAKIAGLLEEWTADLRGHVSANEFIMMITKGWICRTRPGGCTLFMCSPKDAMSDSSLCRKDHIRQVMGIDSISSDQVDRLAKREIYLPDSFNNAEIQLATQITLVDRMTSKDGIASEGYRYGLDRLRRNHDFFSKQLHLDNAFLTKFGNFLDSVQQEFFKKLSEFGSITAAAPTLQGWMTREIDMGLSGISYSIVPNWQLPQSFHDYTSPPTEDGKEKQATTKGKAKAPGSNPKWWSTNPEVFKPWCYPVGKNQTNYFSRTLHGRGNLLHFPQAPHHKTDQMATICIKYQSKGMCEDDCYRTHVPRSRMTSGVRNATDEAYSKAFKNPEN